jgi:hypothetical protein
MPKPMPTTAEKYEVYAVRQLPSEVLGEAYAVVTATRISRKDWLAAYFLLTQWPAGMLQQGSVVVSVSAWKLVQPKAVLERVLDAGRRQAELALQTRVAERLAQIGRAHLAQQMPRLKPCASPFIGCWMLGRFKQQLLAMQAATPCGVLARDLSLLHKISVFQFVAPRRRAAALPRTEDDA